MSKWKIVFSNVGRKKVCKTIVVDATGWPDAKQRALGECSKYLTSRDIGLADHCDSTYNIVAGCRCVGKVSIGAL